MSRRTLVITNDFPPREGGIQSFVYGLVAHQPQDSIVVFAPKWQDSAQFDASQQFPVVRHPHSLMLPTPSVLRRAREIAKAEGCTNVLFGATAPLAALAHPLRDSGVERVIGMTHGHEAAWASTPGPRGFMHQIGESTDCITYLGEYTRRRIAKAFSPAAAARMRQLVPGVDDEEFNPRNVAEGLRIRRRYGLADRPVIVCVSRLMPRKGQDTLIHALPFVRREIPDAALLLVGGGPYRRELERLVENTGQSRNVVLTGSISAAELPAYYAAGDVFSMPCRTRNKGWDVEGLGIVYLEASASGIPVVAGNSGGAPDAVLDGETGLVVPGRSPSAAAEALIEILGNPRRAAEMGQAGRRWVKERWQWPDIAARLTDLLDGRDPDRDLGTQLV